MKVKANYSYVIFVIKGINIFCVLKCFSKNFLYWDCLTKLFYRFYNCVSFFAASEICNRVHGQCLPAVYLRHDKTAIWQKHGWLRERERDREGGGVYSHINKKTGVWDLQRSRFMGVVWNFFHRKMRHQLKNNTLPGALTLQNMQIYVHAL